MDFSVREALGLVTAAEINQWFKVRQLDSKTVTAPLFYCLTVQRLAYFRRSVLEQLQGAGARKRLGAAGDLQFTENTIGVGLHSAEGDH